MYGTPKWYLLLRAYAMFQSDRNRAPGVSTADLDEDVKTIKVSILFVFCFYFLILLYFSFIVMICVNV